jgi:outer membrane protein
MCQNILALLVSLFSFSALAQTPLSLEQAIEAGLANSLQLKGAQTNIAIAENNNNWANAGKAPTIDASLGFNNSFLFQENPASVLLEQTSLNNALVPGLNLNWTLFNGYRIKFTKAQLDQLEAQSQLNARTIVEGIVQEITLNYYQALVQQSQLDVLEEVLSLSRDRIAYEKARQEFGQAVTFDLLQTRDAYLNDSTNYILQQNNLDASLRNLKLAMRENDLSIEYRLSDSLGFDPQNYKLESLEQDLLSQNNSLKLQQLNRELTNINTRIQESARYPTVSLGAGLNYTASLANGEQVFSFNPDPQTISGARANAINSFVNITASYRLFDGGIRKRSIENAQKQEIIAQYNTEDLKQQLRTQLANTLAGYEAQRRLVEVTQSRVENDRQNLDIARERFQGGLISSFDYRTIQLNFINANQNLLNALFNLKSTEVELMRLTGKLIN